MYTTMHSESSDSDTDSSCSCSSEDSDLWMFDSTSDDSSDTDDSYNSPPKTNYIADFNHHISGVEGRNLTWTQTLGEEQRRITEEEDTYRDILWVKLVDTYRNLPKKLLQFHKKLQEISSPMFIMKTDDDCFLNIKPISRGLRGLKLTNQNNTWWSSFRDQWFVERCGKWKEMSYTTDVYPRFACGTGNIVTSDISQWLAKNSDSLHQYQGEDVSMGIWLAAKGVHFMQDDRWLCDNQCRESAIAVSGLSVEEMKTMWDNLNKCGTICTCGKS